MAKIKVYFGDDQPSRASPDTSFTGVPMQILGSPTTHHVAADDDDHSPSKKRKVSFIKLTPQPVGDNVEEPHSSQTLPNSESPPEVPTTLIVTSAESENVEGPDSTLPMSEPPSEVPVILDAISADAEEAHETSNKAKKRKTGNTAGEKKKGKNEYPILEDQSLGEKIQSDIAVVTRKDPEVSPHHTTEQVDFSKVDDSTRPPTKRVRMEVVIVGKESNAALSVPIPATSISTTVVNRAKSMFYKISTPHWHFTVHFKKRTGSKTDCIHFST